MSPLLIYCAGGSRRYAEIATAAGFLYGCRSDHTPNQAVAFVDLNWKRPDLERHLAFVREHQPLLAVAPDVLSLETLSETLRYAERLAEHAERVVIVPKAAGVMAALPREPRLVIGYSVPTRYGGADALLAPELDGWPVHLLGGSPMAQIGLAHYMAVFSADGNASTRAARWGTWYSARRNGWVSRDYAAMPVGPDLPYRAFERSCQEIVSAWQRMRESA